MIDASREFMKDGPKNRLRERDIHKIVDVYTRRRELSGYARAVPLSEIESEANDYNLNIPRYIDAGERDDLHDLHAHLNGGIPARDVDALQAYWQVLPGLRDALFEDRPPGRSGFSREQRSPGAPIAAEAAPTDSATPAYLDARLPADQVRSAILAHESFRAFAATVATVSDVWCQAHRDALHALAPGSAPRELIQTLAEDLLERFAPVPLLDRYAVYQRLMDYWADTMQDDVYLIAADGWLSAARPRAVVIDADRKLKEAPDLVVGSGRQAKKYKLDLIPPALLIASDFAAEQTELDRLRGDLDTASRALEEFIEEQAAGEDDDLLGEVKGDNGKVAKAEIPKRLKALKGQTEVADEVAALKRCKSLLDTEADARKAVKDAEEALNAALFTRYRELDEARIKALAVDAKWLTDLRAAITAEVERLTNQLAARVRELEERYAEPLPKIEREMEALAAKVAGHLAVMGVEVGV